MFPATQLSVLERIASGDATVKRVAFDDLVGGYWQPSYRYLRLQWRLTPEDAEDAVQGFFFAAFEKDYLNTFDPAKGRFRTFLRVCLDRYVQNVQKAQSAAKRGGRTETVALDFAAAERGLAGLPTAISDAERFFHDETVRALFARAVAHVRAQFEAADKAVMFRVFEQHDLAPVSDTTYASIAAALNLTQSQVTNYLHHARAAFRAAALAELRAISASDEEYARDARTLFGAAITR